MHNSMTFYSRRTVNNLNEQ